MSKILSLLAILFWLKHTLAHEHTAYAFEADSGLQNAAWMARIDGTRTLRSMSLPGSHDTMGYNTGMLMAKTQSLTLEIQLRAGIRVLDIRCRHISNSFQIHHGQIYLNFGFNDVMDKVIAFLNANPTETVLMRISKEYTDADNTRSFEDTFLEYHAKYAAYFWTPTSQDPNLNEARKKVVILQDMGTDKFPANGIYGLRYSAEGWNIQDNFEVSSTAEFYSKWEAVRDQLHRANGDGNNPNHPFYVNFFSAAGAGVWITEYQPFFIASGHKSPETAAARSQVSVFVTCACDDFPRLPCDWVPVPIVPTCTFYEGINILAYDKVIAPTETPIGYIGIIMMDFPGDGLIAAIIRENN